MGNSRSNNISFDLTVAGRSSISLTMDRAAMRSTEQIALLAAFMNILKSIEGAAITVTRRNKTEIVVTHAQMLDGSAPKAETVAIKYAR